MRSYKLYVAIMAISCILLQGVNAGKSVKPVEPEETTESPEDSAKLPEEAESSSEDSTTSPEETNESDDNAEGSADETNETADEETNTSSDDAEETSEVMAEVVNIEKCEEYKSKIWNEAFGNPKAMNLVKLTMGMAQIMSSDEVCTDTTLTLLKLVKVAGTNEEAHTTAKHFYSLILAVLDELDLLSTNSSETKKVFNSLTNDPNVRNLVEKSLKRTLNLLQDKIIRGRLHKMLKIFVRTVLPNENEKKFRSNIQDIKEVAKQHFQVISNAKNTIRRLF